jgi:hypothetical protein
MKLINFMRWMFAALVVLLCCHGTTAAPPPPPLTIVYFVPRDRQPIAGYNERIDRVMTEVRRFYREGMESNGYGPRTFELARDDDGALQVHLVHGKAQLHEYGRNDAGKVRQEVKAALGSRGIDIDQETVVIFQVLLEWRNGRATEVGPYVGGGNHLSGTAWVYDDALLDPRQLESGAPGGYYHRPCSVGQFNSHYIGGVAHELGHALGLPHVAGPRTEKRRSLMGDGNHSYGQELRGEGPGSYLHPASAMQLARHLRIAGPFNKGSANVMCRLIDLDVRTTTSELIINGTVAATPQPFGIIGFLDSAAVPGDYDATGWTAPVDGQGQFSLSVGGLDPGSYELRLQVCLENGASHAFPFEVKSDPEGGPDASGLLGSFLLSRAMDAYSRDDSEGVELVSRKLLHRAPNASQAQSQVKHLLNLLDPPQPASIEEVPAESTRTEVSKLRFESASVGWGRPLRDQVLRESNSSCLISVGGKFHQSGLYAHAPSRYVLAAKKGWKRFGSGYGLQDGKGGSVIFVVLGDGKELFRSPTIRDNQLRQLKLEIAGVDLIELVVEDGGDGNGSDWAVWAEPVLER